MAKLIPFVLVLGLGVFVGISLSKKLFADASGQDEWERKYRDLLVRHRELTRRLGDSDAPSESAASRLRQTLWDVKGILRDPDSISPQRARSALEEIEAALRDSAER